MTEKEAKNLLPQTIVVKNDRIGTVRKINFDQFFVDWSDGKGEWIGFKDAKQIHLYNPPAAS